jgi:serine/threonine protein kinase
VEEGEYTEEETREIVIQIINAVEYLHMNGIAHRDLKVNQEFEHIKSLLIIICILA